MSKHTRARTVYIKKLDDPLILDQYELTTSQARNKMYKPERYWRIYKELEQDFLEMHYKMTRAMLDEKFVPPWLADEYQTSKDDFLEAQKIINRDYERAV